MRRAIVATAAVVSALLVLALALAAFVPVTFVATTGVSEQSVADGLWERNDRPTPSTVRIVADDGPARVLITLAPPEVMNPALVVSGQSPREDATYPVRPGEPLIVRGLFGDVRVTALPEGGPVTVRRGEFVQVAPPAQYVEALSPEATFQRTTSMLWRTIPSGVTDPAGLRAWVANTEIDLAGSDSAPVSKTGPPAVRTAASGLLTLAFAGLLILLSWLFGRSLDRSPDTSAAREFARTVAGAALSMTILNTLAYFLPVRVAMPLLVIAISVVVAVRWWRDRPVSLRASARSGFPLLGLALLPTAVAFFPLFMWGPTYAGEYKTDIFEYGTLASLARDNSLFALHGMPLEGTGPLTSGAGFSWRSIDSIAVSGLSVLGLSTVTSLVVSYVMLFLLFALGFLALRKATGGGRIALAISVLALLAPAFSGLMVEGYYSQYFLLAFLPALILTAWLAVTAAMESKGWSVGFLGWALAAVLAVMGAAYPYFLAVIVVGVALAVLVNRARLVATLRLLPLLAVQVLLLINLAMLTVLNFSDTEVYQDGLDAIARNVLLSGFTGMDKVMLVAGFEPYHWRYDQFPATAAMGFPGEIIWRAAASAARHSAVEIAVLVGLIVVTLVAIRWRSSLRSFGFLATLGTVVVWIAFAAFFASQDSPYTAFKALWTAAVVLPLIFATATWRPRLLPVLLVVVMIASLFWLRTVAADRAAWVVPRNSAGTATSHQSIQVDLDHVRALLESGQTVEIRTGEQPLSGSDRDRVALAQSLILALDADVSCPNCRFGSVDPQLTCETNADAEAPDVIITIGASGRDRICDRSLVYDGQIIEVYK